MFGNKHYKKNKRFFTEKRENYNDFYGAKYRSEREFNLGLGNDYGIYSYIQHNKKSLKKRVKQNPRSVAYELRKQSQWCNDFNPRSMRKSYIKNSVLGSIKEMD